MAKEARRHVFEDGGYLFIAPGNLLSAKDPRTIYEIASVGYFTGAGNIVKFIGPWDEANREFDEEARRIGFTSEGSL